MKKKLFWIVITFFIIHLLLQFGAFLFSFSIGMGEFDNPDSSILRIKSFIYDGIYFILTFPIGFIFNLIYTSFLGSYYFSGYFWFFLPFILNSILWTFIVYFLSKKYLLMVK